MDRRKSPSSLSYQQASSLTRAQPSSCALVTYERAGGQPKCRPRERPTIGRVDGASSRYEVRTTGLGDKTQVHYTQSRRDWLKRSDHRSPRVVPRRLARTYRVEFRNVKKERSCFAPDHFELAPLRASSSRSFFLFLFCFLFSPVHEIFLERQLYSIFESVALDEEESEEFRRYFDETGEIISPCVIKNFIKSWRVVRAIRMGESLRSFQENI